MPRPLSRQLSKTVPLLGPLPAPFHQHSGFFFLSPFMAQVVPTGRGDALATCGDIESNPGPTTGRPASKRKQSPRVPAKPSAALRDERPEVSSLQVFTPSATGAVQDPISIPDADPLELQAYYEALTALPPEPREAQDASVATLMNTLQQFFSEEELRLMEGAPLPLPVPLPPPPLEDPMLLDSSVPIPPPLPPPVSGMVALASPDMATGPNPPADQPARPPPSSFPSSLANQRREADDAPGPRGPFPCPFPNCPKRGNHAYQTLASTVQHVRNVHVINGDVPCLEWLTTHNYWVCGHCHDLKSSSLARCRTENCWRVTPDRASTQVPPRPRQIVTPVPLPGRTGTPWTQPCPAPLLYFLQQSLNASLPLFRHIPRAARAVSCQSLAVLIDRIVSPMAVWEDFVDLSLFPKVTLHAPKRGDPGKTASLAQDVKTRCEAVLRGDAATSFQSLPRAQPSRTRGHQQDTSKEPSARMQDPSFQSTLQALLDEGAYSKAVGLLTSSGVLSGADPAVVDKMRALHPMDAPPPPIPDSGCWLHDPSATATRERVAGLRKIILSFPLASAAGPSGLRPSHLQDVLRKETASSVALLHSLDRFSAWCLQGKVPPDMAPFLCSARLIALRKPDCTAQNLSLRPIAVGEVLRRIVSKVACGSAPGRVGQEYLRPIQCGVGVPGAAECVGQAVQRLTQHPPSSDWVLFQADIINAFNMVSRQAILEEVSAQAPPLLPWTRTCYGSHSHLVLDGVLLPSARGVQQGDPLAPFLFALAIHPVVAKLPALPLNSWYLDDGTIACPVSQIPLILDHLHQGFSQLGLSLNPRKCFLWGPGLHPGDHLSNPALPTALASHSLLSSIPLLPFHPGTGVRVLGVPVEHPATSTFRTHFLDVMVDQLEHVTDLLGLLGQPVWQYHMLVKSLDACKFFFVLRSINSSPCRTPLHRASTVLRRALGDILGVSSVTDPTWLNAQLPTRLGGIGLKDPAILADAARLSGILTFHSVAPRLGFGDCPGGLSDDFPSVCQGLAHWLGESFEPLAPWLRSPPLASSIDRPYLKQSWWSDHLQQAVRRSLPPVSTTRDACRLQLQQSLHSSAWLAAVPHKGVPSLLTASEFRTTLRWWLGLPLCAPAAPLLCPLCGEAADVYGDHWLCCSSSLLTRRHNSLRDYLAQFLRTNGFPCSTEVTIGGKERPADVALEGFESRPLAMDLTISHPLKPSAARDPDTVGRYLRRREEEKLNKYSSLCATAGWVFQPVALHPFAGTGPLTSAFLDRLIRRVAGDCQGLSRTILVNSFWQGVGLHLMKGVVSQLHSGLASLQTPAPLPTNTLPLQALPVHPNLPEEPLLDLAGNLLPAALPVVPPGEKTRPVPHTDRPALQHGPVTVTVEPPQPKRRRTRRHT